MVQVYAIEEDKAAEPGNGWPPLAEQAEWPLSQHVGPGGVTETSPAPRVGLEPVQSA